MIQVCVCQRVVGRDGTCRDRMRWQDFAAVPAVGDRLLVANEFEDCGESDVTQVCYSQHGVPIIELSNSSPPIGMSWKVVDAAESRRRRVLGEQSPWTTFATEHRSSFALIRWPAAIRQMRYSQHLQELSVLGITPAVPVEQAPIGSELWFVGFNAVETAQARDLVMTKTPVRFVTTDDAGVWQYVAVFEGVDFWAAGYPVTDLDGFDKLSALVRQWNDHCGVTTPHITDITAKWLKDTGLLLTREMSLLDTSGEGLEYRSGVHWTDDNRVGVYAIEDRWRVEVADPESATILTLCEIAERQQLIRLLTTLGVSADLCSDDL